MVFEFGGTLFQCENPTRDAVLFLLSRNHKTKKAAFFRREKTVSRTAMIKVRARHRIASFSRFTFPAMVREDDDDGGRNQKLRKFPLLSRGDSLQQARAPTAFRSNAARVRAPRDHAVSRCPLQSRSRRRRGGLQHRYAVLAWLSHTQKKTSFYHSKI